MKELIVFGWKTGFRLWRVGVAIYLFQFFLVLFIGVQCYDVIKDGMSHSLSFNDLILHYDHTVITEFLKTQSQAISGIINQFKYLIIIWILIAVFIDGGQLFAVTQKDNITLKKVGNGALVYFIPFAKMALVFLVLAILWTSMLFIPMVVYLEAFLRYFSSEKYVVWQLILLFIIWILGLSFLFSWSVLSRMERMKNGSTVFLSIKNGWMQLMKNKWTAFILMILFIFLHLLLIGFYLYLDATSGMISSLLVFIFFILQQCFVLIRIQLRQMIYACFVKMAK